MSQIGKVSLRGLVHEELMYTFLLTAGIVRADEGKAVVMSTVANTVSLAGDGDEILGRLELVEDRTIEGVLVGTISLGGGRKFLINPDATASSPDELPAPGDYLEGAEDDTGTPVKGYVQRSATATSLQVTEVTGTVSCVAVKI